MKKLISVIMSLALLLSSLGLITFADELPSQPMPSVKDTMELSILNAAGWTKGSGTSSFKNGEEGELLVYSAAEKVSGAVVFSYTFDSAVTFSGINEICLTAQATAKAKKCKIGLTAYGENGVYSNSVETESNVKKTLYFKFPEKVTDDIVKLQISVSTEDAPPTCFSLYSAYVDDCYSYSYTELYDTVRFTDTLGDVVYSEKSVVITSEGNAELSCELAGKPSKNAASVVVNASSTGSGIIYLEDPTDGTVYQRALYSGTNSYTFFLSDLPQSIKLGFSHGDGTGTAKIVLNSMEVTDLSVSNYSELGAVSSCRLSDDKIILSGTITSDAAVTYMNTHLGLFRVPAGGEMEKDPIAKIKISTMFELSAKADHNTSLYRYVVAIVTDEGAYPISSPMFASSYSDSHHNHSHTMTGLINPTTEDAFEADSKVIMLDVHAEKLLSSGGNSSGMYSYNEKLYSINTAYVEEIRHDIDFYNGLDYAVYLRINVSESKNPYNYHTLENLSAVLSYLATEADGIDGYALLPDFATEGGSAVRASYAALALGVLSESVRRIDPESEIFYCVSSGENIFASHISYFAKLYGASGISAVYEIEAESELTSVRTSTDSSSFKRVMLTALSSDVCSAVYESASKAGVYAVLLDTKDGFDRESFTAIGGEHEEKTAELVADAPFTGKASLWNFRDNFSTFGWISGGGFSAPQTVKVAGGRALRSTLTGGNGTLLVTPSENMSLAASDGIFLNMSLSGTESAGFKVTVGYANGRTVYSGSAESGELTFYAALDSTETPTYIAVTAEGGDGLVLDISRVGVYSESLSDEELQGQIISQSNTDLRQMNMYYIIGASALVLTVIIFLLLTKKKEDKESEASEE